MVLSPLQQLASNLAGEFENRVQAAADPVWYVHLRLWQRPVLALSEDGLMLFLEQANLISGKAPYRQRLLKLKAADGQLRGQYYALRQPLKFQGAGQQPTLLTDIKADDFTHLPDCELRIESQVKASGPAFKATLPEGELCSFEINGQRKYVHLGFEVSSAGNGTANPTELLIYDKGVDPDTQKGLWGALMGPYWLIKQQDYSSDWRF